jgi:hypothetical protein
LAYAHRLFINRFVLYVRGGNLGKNSNAKGLTDPQALLEERRK